MRREQAIFREARPAPPFWTVRFETPHPPEPGRFVLADFGGPLREALFPSAVEPGAFTVTLPPRHPATRLLPGAEVDLLGPLGRGFRLERASRLLLIAEAGRLSPLLPLLAAAPAVALVVEAPTVAQLPPVTRFPPAVELHRITHDGSAGHAGRLETLLEQPPFSELLFWGERLCYSCTEERYPALARQVRHVRYQPAADFAQALVVVPMPCGAGVCEVCRVETRHGERHACTAGPVFDLLELETP